MKPVTDNGKLIRTMNPGGELIAEPMQETDLDEVVAVEQASFAAPWTRKMFQDELANPQSRTIVFRREGVLVGYVCFWVVLDEIHIMNIAVKSDMRSQGYGAIMLTSTEPAWATQGVNKILLEVARKNRAAKRLYQKCGFVAVGFRRNYYNAEHDDAILMEKTLDAADSEETLV